MKTTELDSTELEAVLGGDFAYDVGRVLRLVYFSGGGIYAGYAVGDWVAINAINEAQATK